MIIKKNITLFTVLFVTVGIVLFLNFNFSLSSKFLSSIEKPTKTNIYASSTKKDWSEFFKERETKKAYQVFKKKFKNKGFNTQHTGAHLIGEILYNQEGVEGLTVCDQSFAFGCYHSFFIEAINDHGLSIIPEMDKACIEEYGLDNAACQHGIGHGIIQYTGRNNLPKALKACEDTNQPGPLAGCLSGLFMEYNSSIIFTPESITTDIREMGEDPYYPCNTVQVSEEFKETCYFQLPEWWNHVYRDKLENPLIRIMDLCSKADKNKYKRVCYIASGNVASYSSNYNLDSVLSNCKLAPDKQARDLCLIGASWRFDNIESKKHMTKDICKGVKNVSEFKCQR